MTNPIFIVPSIEKPGGGFRNCPINISYCTRLSKDYLFSADPTIYTIRFEGCIDSRGDVIYWGYSTEQERDADYDRILKAFAATTDEPEPKPVSDAMVLENAINWLEDNATACVVQELRKAMLSERGEKK